MSNKETIRRYWDGKWNERRPEVLDELQASDVVYHGPGGEMRGLEEYKQAYGMFASALHDTHLTVEELVEEGDNVVSRVSVRGVHSGDLMGLPATGRPVELALTTMFRLAGGKIVEEHESYNELELFQQLGMEKELREIADRLLSAFNSRSPEAVAQLYSPAQVTVLPGMEAVCGREGKAALLSGFFRAFPDLRIELRLVVVSGHNIVCEGTMTGTHTGPLTSHAGEVPPTGRCLTLPMVYILTVGADGLIAEDRTYFDNTAFAAQLGLA